MFVEESEHALKAEVRGTTYYFCSKACLNTFTKPETELRNLKVYTALSFALGIPTFIFSWIHVLPPVIPQNLWLFLLTNPVQFIARYNFYRGTYHAVKARSANMDTLIAISTSAAIVVGTGKGAENGILIKVESILRRRIRFRR